MIGNLQGFYHFTGTPGYGLLKIDDKMYRVFNLEMLKGFGLPWNGDLNDPIKITFDVKDNNEIIRLKKIK